MKLNLEKCIKTGVDEAMKDYELTIGMSVKEAVEKQIAKEPINIHKRNGTIYNAECPACGYSLLDVGGICESFDEVEQYAFCPDCGQKIKWED